MRRVGYIFLYFFGFVNLVVVNTRIFASATHVYKKSYQSDAEKRNYKSVSPQVLNDYSAGDGEVFDGVASTYKRVSPDVLKKYREKHGDFFEGRSENKIPSVSPPGKSSFVASLPTVSAPKHGLMGFQTISAEVSKKGGSTSSAKSSKGGAQSTSSSSGSKGGAQSTSSSSGSKGGASSAKGGAQSTSSSSGSKGGASSAKGGAQRTSSSSGSKGGASSAKGGASSAKGGTKTEKSGSASIKVDLQDAAQRLTTKVLSKKKSGAGSSTNMQQSSSNNRNAQNTQNNELSVSLTYRKVPKQELPYKFASNTVNHHCDINYVVENNHLINPLTEPPSICSGDTCDPVTNKCICNAEHFGKTCEHNKYEHIAFDLDCSNMGEEYVSSCLRQTHGGSCPKYRLVWDRLCYRTCAALPGILCTPFVRQTYCANSPECPGLCNDLMDMYCLNAARGFQMTAVAAEKDKLATAPSPASEQSRDPVPDTNQPKGVLQQKNKDSVTT